jgi:hypothetical protein
MQEAQLAMRRVTYTVCCTALLSCLQHQQHWQAACEQAYGSCHKDVSCCQQAVRKSFR